MSNHVNSCILCVCLLFDFRLFTVIDLSLGVLSAQHHDIGKIQIYSVMLLLHQSCSHFVYYRIKKLALLYAYAKKWAVCMDCCVLLLCSLKNKKMLRYALCKDAPIWVISPMTLTLLNLKIMD